MNAARPTVDGNKVQTQWECIKEVLIASEVSLEVG